MPKPTHDYSRIFDLRDRAIIVTGGSSGIGAMLATRLLESGARVAVMARRGDRLKDLVESHGERALAITGDVSSDADRSRAVSETVARFGRLDGLVNNAGIENAAPALRENADQLRNLLEVNLIAPMELAKKCVPAMRNTGGGSIINVTSVAAVQTLGNYVPQASYVASKGGLADVTRELAVQWGRYNVRVNAIAPGFFKTEMTAQLGDADGSLPRWMADRTPLRRPGSAADIHGITHFLLSDASAYVTGQHIPVDGGFTLT